MPDSPSVTRISFSPKKGRNNGDPQADASEAAPADSKPDSPDAEFDGQRKLIRPVLPENSAAHRDQQRRGFRGILTRSEARQPVLALPDASHAESFYFQKQIQSQTLMVFVLESGEQVEGYIEWYDRNCIKVRNSGRVLIYKAAIKYLYKASEKNGEGSMTLV